jgi:MFS transporter, SET family, sugar efflux transporter
MGALRRLGQVVVGPSFGVVLRQRPYRLYFGMFFMLGVTASLAFPLASLFLKDELRASSEQIGTYAIISATGVGVSLASGWMSDRIAGRGWVLRAALCCLITGWVFLGLSTAFWEALVANGVFFAAVGTVSAQLFASLGEAQAEAEGANTGGVTATVRMGYSLGYVVGPVVGSGVAGATSLRVAFFVAAGLYGACLLLTWRIPGRKVAEAVPSGQLSGIGGWTGRGVVVGVALVGCALVMSGDSLKSLYLAIYVTRGLRSTLVVYGSLLSVSAVCEVLIMPSVGAISDRVGLFRTLEYGLWVGVVDYGLLASSTHLWMLYVVQVIHVVVLSLVLALGPTFLQQYTPLGFGSAASVLFAGQSLASVVAGITGALGVGRLGLPGIFWVPSVYFMVVAGAITCWAALRRRGA